MKCFCNALVYSCSSFNFKNDNGNVIEGGKLNCILEDTVVGNNNFGLQSLNLKLNSDTVVFANSLSDQVPCLCTLELDVDTGNSGEGVKYTLLNVGNCSPIQIFKESK